MDEWSYNLRKWWYKKEGGEEMVPVVFLNANNNQTKEENKNGENEKEGDVQVSVDVQSGANDDPLMMIPLSVLRRMQRELDPPPVQYNAQCLCIIERKTRSFYTVMLEEGSPYLPSGAKLADPNKGPHHCIWAEGHHVFSVARIIWPGQSKASTDISFSL